MQHDKLRDRLKKYHADTEVPYKKIASDIGVSYSVFYNFSSGIRGLKEKYYLLLDSYLTEKGY
jgi:hypothetical protein